MDNFTTFAWGTAGSVGLEVVVAIDIITRGTRFPARYRNIVFWALRATLAVFGGLIAVAYKVGGEVPAMHVGAATPAIMLAMARHGRAFANAQGQNTP